MSKTKKKRLYSPSERERALLRAEKVGTGAAGRELGIPPTTISSWRSRAQQKPVAPPAPSSPPTVPSEDDSAAPTTREDTPKRQPSRVAKVYSPSERARALECAAVDGVTAAAERFGMSRFALYDWQRKARLHAQGKLANSPVVGGDEDLGAIRDRRILKEWKAHPGLGPSQIRNQLRRRGFKVSLHTVRCVLDENGYVSPKVRREPVHDQNYEAVRPNHLWHLDFLHRHIHKQRVCVLLILDDFSRFIVGGALWDGERVAAVCETFLTSVNRHGRPEKVMSDGGSAFHAWRGVGKFTRLLEELEVDQLVASIPQVNGKLEVLNANLHKEVFNQETFFDLGEAQRRLSAWINFYNLRRTHHGLGGLLVPADRYFGRADEVLARIEAGAAADGVGEPLPVVDRQLDVFRITSRRGQVEVHLLGQRLDLAFSAGTG